MNSLFYSILAAGAGVLLLAACSGEPQSAKPAEPPPPPLTWTIKHLTPEGTVAVYRVGAYYFANSCIYFDHQVEDKREQRVVCGTIEITSNNRLNRF